MVASKLSPEERQRRKREAARLRQRRCRAKKREISEKLRTQGKTTKKISNKIASPSKRKQILSPGPSPRAIQEQNVTHLSSRVFSLADETDLSTPKRPMDNTNSKSLSTPNSIMNFPQMPPLLNTNGDNDTKPGHNVKNAIFAGNGQSSKPSTPVDENELRAVDAMLSLRNSPVPESIQPKYTLSPRNMTADRSTSLHSSPLMPGICNSRVKKTRYPYNLHLMKNSQFTLCEDSPGMSPKRVQFNERVKRSENSMKSLQLPPGIHYFYH